MKINSTCAISFNRYNSVNKKTKSRPEEAKPIDQSQSVVLSNSNSKLSKTGRAMKNIALSLPVALTCLAGCYQTPEYIDHPDAFVRAAADNENMTVGNIKIENIKSYNGKLLNKLSAEINKKPCEILMQATDDSITGTVKIVQNDNSLKRYPFEIKTIQNNLFEAKIGDKKATILYRKDGTCKILDDKGKEIKFDLPPMTNINLIQTAVFICAVIFIIYLDWKY